MSRNNRRVGVFRNLFSVDLRLEVLYFLGVVQNLLLYSEQNQTERRKGCAQKCFQIIENFEFF